MRSSYSTKVSGPAIVRSVQIFVDGKPQRNWDSVYAALGLKFAQRPPYSTVSNIVISPNDHIDHVCFKSVEDFNLYSKQADRVEKRICYCSTLNECWMHDEREKDAARVYHEVDTCPAKSQDDFIDNDIAEAAPPAKEDE